MQCYFTYTSISGLLQTKSLINFIFEYFKTTGSTAYQPVHVVIMKWHASRVCMEPLCDKSTTTPAAVELDVVEVINYSYNTVWSGVKRITHDEAVLHVR